MKPNKIRDINHVQQGFTLIELLIAIAIAALICVAVAEVTVQVERVNASSSNRQVAVVQVQNAVQSISRDAEQSQQVIPQYYPSDLALPLDTTPAGTTLITFSLSSTPAEQIMFQWFTWDNNLDQITYTLTNGILKKTTMIDSVQTGSLQVASNIINISGNWDTKMKVLSITTLEATVGTGTSQRSETRTFQINPRSAQ